MKGKRKKGRRQNRGRDKERMRWKPGREKERKDTQNTPAKTCNKAVSPKAIATAEEITVL